jgi:hypothetical protein
MLKEAFNGWGTGAGLWFLVQVRAVERFNGSDCWWQEIYVLRFVFKLRAIRVVDFLEEVSPVASIVGDCVRSA